MSGTPELTITVTCATCGGTGKRYAGDGEYRVAIGDCDDCDKGVVRTPVSCASCRWWHKSHYCDGPIEVYQCGPDHGCLEWTAKEATDGNG